MSATMTEKYGDYTIRYNESTNKWTVDLGEEIGLADKDTLRQAREYCDNRDKRLESGKRKQDPIKVYYLRYGIVEATVTSITEDGEAWITYMDDGKKQRTKVYSGYRGDPWDLCEITPENTEKAKKIIANYAERKRLDQETGQLERSMKRLIVKADQ